MEKEFAIAILNKMNDEIFPDANFETDIEIFDYKNLNGPELIAVYLNTVLVSTNSEYRVKLSKFKTPISKIFSIRINKKESKEEILKKLNLMTKKIQDFAEF